MNFFTADLHLSHKKLAEVRGFKTVHDMNVRITNGWNSVVTNEDIVYILGDITMHLKGFEYANVINKLNGKRFYLIPGNHDKIKDVPEQINILDHITCINLDDESVVLCHYAMLVWPKSHYGSWLIHGHSHGGLNGKADFLGKALDVAIECHDYKPLSWPQIKDIMAKKGNNFNLLNHHGEQDVESR